MGGVILKKINNVHITFFRIGNKYNLPQYVKLDMTGNKMKYYYNYCISDLTDDEEKIITEYIERNFNKENGFFEFDKEQSVRIPLNDVEKNYEDMNMPCLYVIVEYDDGSKLLQASGNLFFEDVPNVIDCFLKSIKIIMNNHKYDEINLEKSMIEIAIYLRMSRASDEQNLYLNECIYFLRDEIWASQDGHPIYQIDRGDPINKLSSYFIGINNEQYKQIIESVIQKIGYYSEITAGMPLMELSSEKMVENLAYEIIYVNKGTEELKKEIAKDREAHGKKPLKEKDDHLPPSSGEGNVDDTQEQEIPEDTKTEKMSISDPESGWFRKREHKHVFAYTVQTACDKHGWILGYSVHKGNEHDSRTFKVLYDKIKHYSPDKIVADAGYRTPAIARELLNDGIEPLFPYKRPMTKEGFFKKYEYVYDEYYDCYLCPENHILSYRTTNRDGYKEYKSCGEECKECPHLKQCTNSKNHVKVITRHVWEEYMEKVEDIRHTLGNKEIYRLRKETIERIFGTAKEQHGFRYTQYKGKARMEMKAGLTFACMNLKKLAKILAKREEKNTDPFRNFSNRYHYFIKVEKLVWSFAPLPTLSTV